MRNRQLLTMSATVLCAAGLGAAQQQAIGPYWTPANAPQQREFEQQLQSTADAENLRELHSSMCAEPHPAGTAADQRMIALLSELFESYGLSVQQQTIHPLLARPISASVTILDDAGNLELPVAEPAIDDDPYSTHALLMHGWNAYSGSGSATGEVVYANFGTKDDFQTLAELGIDVRGRIVLARYGRNFRGYKAKFAEEAGAAGLLIYTDPADSGYVRGPVYPEGGWAYGGYIQNGSIKTLSYPGDPLTPFEPATIGAPRLDVNEVALPGIPVQPIGWDAAQEILSRMTGEPLPRELRNRWQGGLPLAYRLTGGGDLHVRVRVEQQREIVPTSNVLGVVEGAQFPGEVVVVGCHFDAWTFGAGDPHAGSIVLMEMARCFGEAAAQGKRPARTVIFANWAAEEFGIIGSTEWVEANRDHLLSHAVAYVNLDMAAMGPYFGCSSAPSLKRIIAETAASVPHMHEEFENVLAQWGGDAGAEPSYGTLGGGSDHVGFYCHVGVPSCGLGAGGSDGVSYHSNIDNLTWYRQVVGDDYQPALMLARLGNVLVARLANADLVPLDPTRYAEDVRGHLESLQSSMEQHESNQFIVNARMSLTASIDRYEQIAASTMNDVHAAVASGAIEDEALEAINNELITLERCWLRNSGLDGRPWYRSLYAATDPSSGYGAWPLPGLRGAIERDDARRIEAELGACQAVFDAMTRRMELIGGLLGP